MPRYRLVVEYDGTRYSGWQVQRNARSVQGALITALNTVAGDVGEVMGSGRTDSGVHAVGQVAHADLARSVDGSDLRMRLNDVLHHDINVLQVHQAPPRFHARHDAIGRSYVYQITRQRTAFLKRYVWWVRDPLDTGAIRRAAATMVGMHDYRGFADAERATGALKVLVESIDIAEAGEMVLVRVRASHFLRKMVRRMVGALVEVGRGTMPITAMADALEDPEHHAIALTAPPSGLFLDQVIYPGESFRPELVPPVSVSTMRR